MSFNSMHQTYINDIIKSHFEVSLILKYIIAIINKYETGLGALPKNECRRYRYPLSV